MKKVVGKVTEEEKSVIKKLYDHKNSLEELLLVLTKNDELYNVAFEDMNETKIKYQEWWNQHYKKYQWEKGEGDWTVMFDTNDVIIESL